MKWLALHIDTSPAGLEPVENMLISLGIDSFAVEDEADFHQFLEQNKQYWDYVDEELDRSMSGKCRVTFYAGESDQGFAQVAAVRMAMAELKKAQDLIRARDEYVENAKKEAEKIRRQADMDAKTIVEESEITRIARDKAQQMLRQAGDRANGMIGGANEYTDDALRRTEEAIQMALEEIRESRARFRAVSNEKLQAQRARLEEQRGDGDRRR